MLRYTTDRARLGLVAFYDIRPGNGVGLFLQPWNLHGATVSECTSPRHRYHERGACGPVQSPMGMSATSMKSLRRYSGPSPCRHQ